MTRLLAPVAWWGRMEVRGLDCVPARGAVLVVANHDSQFDPVLLGVALRRRRALRFLARANLFRIFGLGPILRAMNQIPLERGAGDTAALGAAVDALAAGQAVCIFPEGRLSLGRALRARSGAGRLLVQAPGSGGAPAVGAPVFCHPAERADVEGDGGLHYFHWERLPTRGRRLRAPLVMRLADGGPVAVAETLEEGDEVAGFTVVHLPGHAPGLIALWRERDRLALCADAFVASPDGIPSLSRAAYTLDEAQSRASLRKLAALEPAAAWPTHGPPLRGNVRAALEAAAGT